MPIRLIFIMLCLSLSPAANASEPVQSIAERGVLTVPGLGSMQGIDQHRDVIYLYGDAATGIIRRYEWDQGTMREIERPILLTRNGDNLIPHPTGLSHHPEFGTVLGNTVDQVGTIYFIDWQRAASDAVLDNAVQHAVRDDLAINGTRPEFVEVNGRVLVATSDYGGRGNEIRLYSPAALRSAGRTSEPGVLVHKFAVGPYVQNLHWLADTGELVLVQNTVAGLGWRLTFLDLARSVAAERAMITAQIDLTPRDELEGFHLIRGNCGLGVSSSGRRNVRLLCLRR